jgi:hypothetical protein
MFTERVIINYNICKEYHRRSRCFALINQISIYLSNFDMNAYPISLADHLVNSILSMFKDVNINRT